MNTTTHVFTARCDDCGTEHQFPPVGGMVPECCDLGDLRRLSLRRDDGEWIAHPNYKRDTVDGPPALLADWSQGTDSYELYVNGKAAATVNGAEIAGAHKPGETIKLINRLLAAAHAPS